MENDLVDDSSANETDIEDKPKYINYGQLQVFVQYQVTDLKLVIKVLGAKDLINYADSDKSAYVNLVVLSRERKSKRTKRKTRAVKPSPEPVWEETFEFDDLTMDEVKGKTVEMTVKNECTIFKRNISFMGRCVIDLGSLQNIEDGQTAWYKLQSKQAAKELIN